MEAGISAQVRGPGQTRDVVPTSVCQRVETPQTLTPDVPDSPTSGRLFLFRSSAANGLDRQRRRPDAWGPGPFVVTVWGVSTSGRRAAASGGRMGNSDPG